MKWLFPKATRLKVSKRNNKTTRNDIFVTWLLRSGIPQTYNNSITNGDSRLSGKRVREKKEQGNVQPARRQNGPNGWNSRSGIQDNSHLIPGYSPCDEAVRYYTPRRVFSSRYRRPQVISSPILLSSLMHSRNPSTSRHIVLIAIRWDRIAIVDGNLGSLPHNLELPLSAFQTKLYGKRNCAPYYIYCAVSGTIFVPVDCRKSTVFFFLPFSARTLTVIYFFFYILNI